MNHNKQHLIIFTFFAVFFSAMSATGQEIKHQFGNESSCIVDSNTVTIFLASIIEEEGLTFIVNNDGKVCSSGKNNHPDDFDNMLYQLVELKSKSTITEKTYQRLKCSLEKDKMVKEYLTLNPSTMDEKIIIKIMNDTKCN